MSQLNLWYPVLAGPAIGSFLGVLIRRLPEHRTVLWGRSACEGCSHPLGPADLVPIASFLALRGRCRYCRAPIAPAHLVVELAAVAVPVMALAAGVRSAPLLWSGCGLGWTLLALGWIDLRSFILPDALTLPLVVAGLAVCRWQHPALLADRALAAMAGYAALRAVALIYRRLRHRDGLGHGDAKLFAAAGAWTGIAALPAVLLGAALIGLATAGAQALRGRPMTRTTRLPFGPPLAAAIWVVWVVG